MCCPCILSIPLIIVLPHSVVELDVTVGTVNLSLKYVHYMLIGKNSHIYIASTCYNFLARNCDISLMKQRLS
jgi:hypothetical protein